MNNKEAFEILKKLGSSASHEFVQAEKTTLKEVTEKYGSEIQKGMCDGLCHDWVRRVLQHGKLEFGPKRNDEKEKKAAVRAGYGQSNVLGLKKSEFQKDFLGSIFSGLYKMDKNKPVPLNQKYESILSNTGFLDKKKGNNGHYAWDYLHSVLLAASGDDDFNVKSTWQLQSRQWDQAWTKERGNESRHPFQKINRINDTHYKTHSDVYEAIAVALKELIAGDMAVIIGFHTDKMGTEGGHAIAVNRDNTGKYRFFDPNYGIFEYKTATVAAVALVFVLQYSYPRPLGTWEPIRSDGRFDIHFSTFVPAVGWKVVANDPPVLSSVKTKQTVLKAAKLLAPKKSGGTGVTL